MLLFDLISGRCRVVVGVLSCLAICFLNGGVDFFFSWVVDLSNLCGFSSFSLVELDCSVVCLICIIRSGNCFCVVDQKICCMFDLI